MSVAQRLSWQELLLRVRQCAPAIGEQPVRQCFDAVKGQDDKADQKDFLELILPGDEFRAQRASLCSWMDSNDGAAAPPPFAPPPSRPVPEAVRSALKDGSSKVPLDCLVNFALLTAGARRLIQFDMKWITDEERDAANKLVKEEYADLVSWRADKAGNLAIFLKENEEAVSKEIEETGGMRSIGYAKLLDPVFYCCGHDLTGGDQHVYKNEDLTQVSVSVIQSHTRTGVMMAQMLTAEEVSKNLGRLHCHYLCMRQHVAAIDPSLQLTFSIYSKPGDWDSSPTYAPATLKDA